MHPMYRLAGSGHVSLLPFPKNPRSLVKIFSKTENLFDLLKIITLEKTY